MSDFKLYFSLKKGFELYLLPTGGRIVKSSEKIKNIDVKGNEYELSQEAARILEKCDGKTELKEILLDILREFKGDPRTIIEETLKFLFEACEMGILDVYNTPCNRKLIKYGSSEYFVPRHLMVEVTDACNLACRHCYRDSTYSGNYISFKILKQILADFHSNGVRTVELTGGEPTTHPEFSSILKYCIEKFNIVSVLTNGYSLSGNILEVVKDAENVVFQVDLDGPTPEVHDWLRNKKGTFDRAVNSIRRIVDNGNLCRVAMNIHAGNFEYIEDVAELAYNLGATWFAFSPILPLGRGENIAVLSNDQFRYCIRITEKLKTKYGDFFFTLDEDQIRLLRGPKENCGVGWRSWVLGPTGKLRPCLMLPEDHFALEGILELGCRNFFEKFKEITAFFYNIRPPEELICGKCPSFMFCAGCVTRPIHVLKKDLVSSCKWTQSSEILEYFKV